MMDTTKNSAVKVVATVLFLTFSFSNSITYSSSNYASLEGNAFTSNQFHVATGKAVSVKVIKGELREFVRANTGSVQLAPYFWRKITNSNTAVSISYAKSELRNKHHLDHLREQHQKLGARLQELETALRDFLAGKETIVVGGKEKSRADFSEDDLRALLASAEAELLAFDEKHGIQLGLKALAPESLAPDDSDKDRSELRHRDVELNASNGLPDEARAAIDDLVLRIRSEKSIVMPAALNAFREFLSRGENLTPGVVSRRTDTKEVVILLPQLVHELITMGPEFLEAARSSGMEFVVLAKDGREQVRTIQNLLTGLPGFRAENVLNAQEIEQVGNYLIDEIGNVTKVHAVGLLKTLDIGIAIQLANHLEDHGIQVIRNLFGSAQEAIGLFGLTQNVILERSTQLAALIAA